jgi:hypothetical protein
MLSALEQGCNAGANVLGLQPDLLRRVTSPQKHALQTSYSDVIAGSRKTFDNERLFRSTKYISKACKFRQITIFISKFFPLATREAAVAKSSLKAVSIAKKQARGPGKPFEKGVSGNPAGRPKGSRNKLSEDFLSALCADFEEHGTASIVTMRENDPASYVKVVAGLVPKDMNVNMKGAEAFTAILHAISAGQVGVISNAGA